MALQTYGIASFASGAVVMELIYDDTTNLVHAVKYKNLTDRNALLKIYPVSGSFLSYTLPPQTDTQLDIPPGQRPDLGQIASFRMSWPAPASSG